MCSLHGDLFAEWVHLSKAVPPHTSQFGIAGIVSLMQNGSSFKFISFKIPHCSSLQSIFKALCIIPRYNQEDLIENNFVQFLCVKVSKKKKGKGIFNLLGSDNILLPNSINKTSFSLPNQESAQFTVHFPAAYGMQELLKLFHRGEELGPKKKTQHEIPYSCTRAQLSCRTSPQIDLNKKANQEQRQRKKHSVATRVTDFFLFSVPKYKTYNVLLPLFSTNDAPALACFSA